MLVVKNSYNYDSYSLDYLSKKMIFTMINKIVYL